MFVTQHSKHENRKIWQHNWRLCLTYESTNEFEPKIDGNQAMTLNILVTLKMKYDDEMIEFINTWKSKLDDCLIVGVDINQKFQSLLRLSALPNSWRNFVITQNSNYNLILNDLINCNLRIWSEEENKVDINQLKSDSRMKTLQCLIHNKLNWKMKTLQCLIQGWMLHTMTHTCRPIVVRLRKVYNLYIYIFFLWIQLVLHIVST